LSEAVPSTVSLLFAPDYPASDKFAADSAGTAGYTIPKIVSAVMDSATGVDVSRMEPI
jgi:hypothetical protein